jgi:hypothetical protein
MNAKDTTLVNLDLREFDDGDALLFCDNCGWQAPPLTITRSFCPECNRRLHLVAVGDELRKEIRRATAAVKEKQKEEPEEDIDE